MGSKDLDDIWVSYRQDDHTWSRAINIGAPVNNRYPNAVVGVGPSGDVLFLTDVYNRKKNQGMAITIRKNRSWSTPETLKIDSLDTSAANISYNVSASIQTLLLSIDGDIYVSFQNDQEGWGKPLALGPIINTSGAETFAFLAADGKTLYFSSNGFGGFGGMDLFMSKRLDETWTSWSAPVNLGESICTANDDTYFSITADGSTAFFTRTDGGGNSDIYQAVLPEHLQPESVTFFTGKVIIDASNQKQFQPSFLSYRGVEEKQARNLPTNPDGTYTIILPYGEDMELDIQQEGYFSLGQRMELSEQHEEDIDVDPNNFLASTLTDAEYLKRDQEIETINLRLRELDGELQSVREQREAYLAKLKEKQLETIQDVDHSFLSDPELDALRHRYAVYNFQQNDTMKGPEPKSEAKPKEYDQTTYRESEELEDMKRRFNSHYKLSANGEKPEEDETDYLWGEKPVDAEFSQKAKKVRQELKKDLLPEVAQELIEEVKADLRHSVAGNNLVKLDVQEFGVQEEVQIDVVESEFTAKGVDLDHLPKEMEWEQQIRSDLRTAMVDDVKDEMKSELKEDVRQALTYEVAYQKSQQEQLALRKELDTKIVQQIQEEEQQGIEGFPKAKAGATATSKTVAPIYREVEMDIMLIPIEVGKHIALQGVLFNPNTAILKPISSVELDKVAKLMKQYPAMRVEVGGHTNGWSSHSFAVKLSTQRAEKVVSYLINQGIDSARLQFKGYGKTQPIASNDTLEGRRKNQRIEIKILNL